MRTALCLSMLALVTGCARYEYNIIEPPDLTQHIGSKSFAIVRVDPLDYRFRAVDGHLLMRVNNPTDDSIQLLGEKSVIVDSQRESHPLASQTIAPKSHIDVLLPPVRPRVGPYGPVFGFGIGARVYRDYDPFFPYPSYYPYSPYYHAPYSGYWPYGYYDYPRYFTVYGGPGEAMYWEWKGEGRINLTLVYKRDDKEFRHNFTIGRQKM